MRMVFYNSLPAFIRNSCSLRIIAFLLSFSLREAEWADSEDALGAVELISPKKSSMVLSLFKRE